MSTVISLYRCAACASQVFQSDIEQGIGCRSCDSRRVSPMAPTARRIAEFFLRNPRMLITFFRENVLGL